MSLTIRAMTPADRAAWDPLWHAYLTFYNSTVADEVSALTFARLTDAADRERGAFVAEMGGAIVGFTHYIFHAHNWRAEGICYLQDLFVAPSARGQGAARALIEAVYAEADARGVPGVYWSTQEGNATARALYDRIGQKTDFIKYTRSAT